MKKVLGFYRTFFQTLNPASYEGFAESKTKNSFSYYFSLVFNALIIFAILLIPVIIGLPETLQSKMDNVATFNVEVDFTTNKPLMFPEENPVLIINYANETPKETANIILHNDVFYIGAILKNIEYNIAGFGDVKANMVPLSSFVTAIIVLMLPTVIILFWLYLLFKYFALVLIATIIVSLLAPLFSYRAEFKKIFNSAMYGISLSVFLDLIFFATAFEFYYIQFLPLLIYTFCGMTASGMKIDSKKKNSYVEVKQRF